MIQSISSFTYKDRTIYQMTDAGAVWFEYYSSFAVLRGLDPEYFDTLEDAKNFIDKEI